MQAVKKMVVSQKSFIISHVCIESMVTFFLQKLCVGVRCGKKSVDSVGVPVCTENVREVLGGVRGARLHNKNRARVCGCLAVCIGTNPTFSS